MFNKPLDEITYEDIKKLKTDNIPESKILDYKREKLEKKDLMKHICGFANANGGFLVFGIEEDESKPPIPKNLTGLNKKNFNIEQIEDIIHGNIDPPLKFEISPPIYKKDKKGEFFVVIRIPEGPDKPYMSTTDGDDRFYFRHNYQTRRMSEIEISSMYRQRFSSPQSVREYLEKIISYNNEIAFPEEGENGPLIFGHVFIFPPNITRRRIEEINDKFLNREATETPEFTIRKILPPNVHQKIPVNIGLPYVRSYNSFGLRWYENASNNRLEVHRNYLIHHVKDYGRVSRNTTPPVIYINDQILTVYLLLTLYFCNWVYRETNLFTPLSVLLHIENTKNLSVAKKCFPSCQNKEIIIEREVNSWELKDKYLEIAKSIMDEFMNYFGYYEYYGFNEGEIFEHLLDSDK